jgi:hypothetical protein
VRPVPLWRVFPWDPDAAEGERFSAAFVPGGQGRNRFDLPGNPLGVIYLAETGEHAVAEMIQAYRNTPQSLTDDDLTVWGHRYALVSVSLAADVWPRIDDLCEPDTLTDLRITADRPAYRDRRLTQQIAATLHDRQRAGLCWWSAFWGEWHTTVLFRDRIPAHAITYGTPRHLDVASPPVVEAARLLDIG